MNLLTPFNLGLFAAAAVAIVLINFGPAIWAWMKTPRATTTTITTVKEGVPTRHEVIGYLDAAYSYFESVGCPEGMKLISDAVPHTFSSTVNCVCDRNACTGRLACQFAARVVELYDCPCSLNLYSADPSTGHPA